MENKMIENLEKNTGKPLDTWIKLVHKSKIEKHKAIIDMLKAHHGLTYGFANLIAHKARKSDAGSADDADLIKDQYTGKEDLKPIYDAIMKEVVKFGADVEVAPKKAYVSLRRKKQFALIQPSTKTRIDVGINLKGKEVSGKLEAAGSWNSMVSHRVKLSEKKEVSKYLINWLKESYNNAG